MEVFFYGPAAPGDGDERAQRNGAAFRHEAQVERDLTDSLLVRDEAAAHHQVVVRVGPTQDGTTVTVRNDGPPTLAPTTPGAGLRGMRERAEGLGGQLTAGPIDDGWLVEAVLP